MTLPPLIVVNMSIDAMLSAKLTSNGSPWLSLLCESDDDKRDHHHAIGCGRGLTPIKQKVLLSRPFRGGWRASENGSHV